MRPEGPAAPPPHGAAGQLISSHSIRRSENANSPASPSGAQVSPDQLKYSRPPDGLARGPAALFAARFPSQAAAIPSRDCIHQMEPIFENARFYAAGAPVRESSLNREA
jgi:hypothetical protein